MGRRAARALAVGFFGLLTQFGCAAQEPATDLGRRVVGLMDSGGRASLAQEELLAVELEARPSAGFTWEIAAIDESVLALAGREHVSTPGLGGRDLERLLFKGVSAGKDR